MQCCTDVDDAGGKQKASLQRQNHRGEQRDCAGAAAAGSGRQGGPHGGGGVVIHLLRADGLVTPGARPRCMRYILTAKTTTGTWPEIPIPYNFLSFFIFDTSHIWYICDILHISYFVHLICYILEVFHHIFFPMIISGDFFPGIFTTTPKRFWC